MNPYRKPFSSDPLFPFELVYKDTKKPQHELPDHLHDRYELVYVYDGKGVLFIDQTFYEMKAGDIFVIPGNTIHRAFPDHETPITSSAIFFDPALVRQFSLGDSYFSLRSFEIAKNYKSFKIHLPDIECNKLEAVMEEMSQEELRRYPGFRQALLLHLQHLLLLIYRVLAASRPEEPRVFEIGPHWMRESLVFIDRHPKEELGLSGLAKRASVTSAHFSRLFKQLTGMNVTDYVNAKRVILAAEMLQDAGAKIEWIAESCGFNSMTHFHRMFKKLTGSTPSVYKRSSAKSSLNLQQQKALVSQRGIQELSTVTLSSELI